MLLIETGCLCQPLIFSIFTLVCPNLYSSWSMSRLPSSFSAAFLLSINAPSGITFGFRMRYLNLIIQIYKFDQIQWSNMILWYWIVIKYVPPLFEVTILNPVGESLSADSDAFQHTVTAQLVHDQRVLHGPRSLGLIGDEATHKVGVSRPQVGHEFVQVLLWIELF